jgi:serine/threonine protein phosphatase 1
MSKIFAIGDIHGCYDALLSLMAKIEVDFERDTLVFIGDYIDRGMQSYQVVDYLIDLKQRHPNIVYLKGNHEEMLERYLAGEDRLTYLANGGQQTLESYLRQRAHNEAPLFPPEHLDFYHSLQLYYETDDYIFVHAGLRAKKPLSQQGPEDMLWIREKFIRSKYDFGKRIVFGHTPFPDPMLESNKIGIDTGAVYGNKLTCLELPAMVFYHVNANRDQHRRHDDA